MTVVLFTPPRSAAPGPAAPAQDWWLASSHNSVRVLKRQIQIVRVLCFFGFFNWMTALCIAHVCVCLKLCELC